MRLPQSDIGIGIPGTDSGAHKEANNVRAAYNAATYEEERRRLASWYADELARLEAGTQAKVVNIR